MKTLKYIGFIILYILYVTVGNSIATKCFNWLYDFSFPINSFFQFIGGSIGVLFMGGIVCWFFIILYQMFYILPKKRVISLILFIYYILNFSYAVYLSFVKNIDFKVLPIIFDVGSLLITLYFAISREDSEETGTAS